MTIGKETKGFLSMFVKVCENKRLTKSKECKDYAK